jgi:hypothetical protein
VDPEIGSSRLARFGDIIGLLRVLHLKKNNKKTKNISIGA